MSLSAMKQNADESTRRCLGTSTGELGGSVQGVQDARLCQTGRVRFGRLFQRIDVSRVPSIAGKWSDRA